MIRKVVVLLLLVSSIFVTGIPSASAGGTVVRKIAAVDGGNCPFPGANGSYHSATYIVAHLMASNVVAWRISLHGESCVNKYGKITAHRWNKSAYVNPDPWNDWLWRSWRETVTGGGIGWNHSYRRVKAYLQLCLYTEALGVSCVKEAYPWIAVTMTNHWPWSSASTDKGVSG